jgi:hypothetical protein
VALPELLWEGLVVTVAQSEVKPPANKAKRKIGKRRSQRKKAMVLGLGEKAKPGGED